MFHDARGLLGVSDWVQEVLMRLELACTTTTLLTEISLPKFNQTDIALTYAMALRSSAKTDWSMVNRAIIERWSFSGLERIKKLAWKRATK
jgi:hypothetical protein